jgi:hypothetical protein
MKKLSIALVITAAVRSDGDWLALRAPVEGVDPCGHHLR